MHKDVFAGYSAAATDLVDPYESIASARLFAPVLHHLPLKPCRVLDIGAGTGRDAAWFARQGHHVTAVEPVEAFTAAGRQRHNDVAITWVADSLPCLETLNACAELIILNGVWHHIPLAQRQAAMATFARLAAAQATLILSIRTGPTPAGRPGFGGRPDGAVDLAVENGFTLVQRISTESHQAGNLAAGVTWDWLVLRHNGIDR